ncbi:TonB-dependent siderophore receptor [Sphingomonas sabuli]|uniref:TonB-dependent siderophore receptor n=2 Tax=Sphingomonas sabuli TaxID=2764186 RepID=A0A7G9L5W0_9SPHN|nr:TonB-dependent siderophore receptor [Sphingomonas sabuli]
MEASASVDAADAIAAAEADTAEPIIVEGKRDRYGARTTSTATKTNTDVKDIPQALTVISERQIEDQQLRSVADLLNFVPGATPGTGEGNRDQFTLRGNNTTADLFVDGIRDDVQYFRDFYNVDRVEVLRGPNAMIFGRGGGGGVVNRVTKRSTLSPIRDVSLAGDSEGGVRLAADLDQPLSGSVGLRVNGVYEHGESFRDHVGLERYGFNPTVGILAGPATRVDLSYEYFHDRRTTDRGVPADNGRPLDGYDDVFFGDPELSFARVDANVGQVAVQRDLSPGLTLRNRTLLGDYDKFYQNVYPSDLDETTGEVVLGAYNNATKRRNLFSQTDLIWKTVLGGVDQTVLFGFEVGQQKSRNRRLSGTFAGSNRVPLSDPTVDADLTFAPSASDTDNRTRATIAALYVQDQIRPSEWLEIVAGLRFDRFKLRVDDYRAAGGQFERVDEMISPRLGIVLKPQGNLSLYANYARSFLPQSGDQFGGLDIGTEALKPERFDNYELGAKWEPVAGLLATAALYQLDRTNTRAPNPDGSGTVVLTGEQRTRGLEIGLERSVTDRWQVSAGYALQKSEITAATSACPAGDCEAPLVPRHSFSMWNRYDVTPALGLGLGLIARSKSFASISNQVVLPGYARVDAAAFYKLTDAIKLQVNVENVFGADYFPTAHNDNNIGPGAPRTVKAAIRFGF